MSTLIVCPNCKTQFEPEAAIAQSVEERLKREYNQKAVEWQKQKDEQFRQRESQMLQQQEQDKRALEDRLIKELSAKVGADYENKPETAGGR